MDIERPYTPPNKLSHAAKIMGVVSLVTSFMGIGFIFAALGFIFAIITKDEQNHFTAEGKSALIMGMIAILINIFTLVHFFTDPVTYQMLNDQCQAVYGITFDEMMEQMLQGTPLADSISFGLRHFIWK